jgi:hypothetical protein
VPLKSVLPLLTRFKINSDEIIIERISRDIFSFFEMKAIHEIFKELNEISTIEMIKNVLKTNSYSVSLKRRFEIAVNPIKTDIVIK